MPNTKRAPKRATNSKKRRSRKKAPLIRFLTGQKGALRLAKSLPLYNLRGLAVLLGVLVVGATAVAFSLAASGSWSGELQLALDKNLCLDNLGSSTANGNTIDVYRCNATAAQKWTINVIGSNRFTLMDGQGTCADDWADGVGTPANRVYLRTYTCNTSDAAQVWEWEDSELENIYSQGCINDPGDSEASGTPQIIYSCSGNPSNELWYEAAQSISPVVKTGELSSALVNSTGQPTCLDDYQDGTANGTAIDLYQCSTTDAAQKWSLYSDNTIRINGKCLDVSGQGTTNGTHIDLYTCNGGANQVWTAGTNGDLVSKQSGSCLDVYGSSTTNDSAVDLWGCDGTNAQTWGWNTGSTIVSGEANNECQLEGGNTGSGGCYFWGQGIQSGIIATGAQVTMSAISPKVSSRDFHSDAEIYVNGSNGDAVEVNDIVGSGSSTPKLLVDFWKGGGVYDSDFVAVSGAPIKNGDDMPTTGTFTIKVEYVNSQWQVYYNGEEVGYYPESVFSNAFTQATRVDIYGEVEGTITEQTTSQMGNGLLGTNPNSSYFSNYSLIGSSSAPDLTVAGPSGDAASVYSVGLETLTGFHYGGPGF